MFSFIISHQWAIHPALRDTANSTVNMSFGMPMALYTMPVQKSTFGQSFRDLKYSSDRAYFSRLIANSSRGAVYWSSTTFSTEQHIFCMMVALGSKFLQTLCPKPISLNCEFLSFAFSMISFMLEPSPSISSSMFKTASLAPPWKGPQREPIPAAMQAQGFACELPAILTVEVEAFCSCSAWHIQMTSMALRISSAISNQSSMGLENIMQRKFFIQPYFFLGYTRGSPMAVRQAQAAKLGILAINLIAISYRSFEFESSSECRKAERAPTTPTMMLMGCESLLKPLQNSIIFQFIIISPTTASQNLTSQLWEGRMPQSRRQQVSMQVESQASCSIGQPRQSSSPFSPLMQQMLEMQLAVHMKPGSQVSRLALLRRERTSMRSGPSVPRKMGSSIYLLPILRMAFSGSSLGYLGVTSYRSCFITDRFQQDFTQILLKTKCNLQKYEKI